MRIARGAAAIILVLTLAACGGRNEAAEAVPAGLYPGETPQMRALVQRYARIHDIPEPLLHRVIQREATTVGGWRQPPANRAVILGADADPATGRPARNMGFERVAESSCLDPEVEPDYGGS